MARTTIRTEDITASEVTTAKMATDPTNASNLSSGSVPLAQLGNVDTSGITANQDDIALLGFKVAANGSLARYNLVDQSIDAFEDASGVDASASTNELRDASGKYYEGGTLVSPTVSGNYDSSAVDGDYTYYKWTTATSSGSYTTDAAQDYEYLVVAGGGSGGAGRASSHHNGGGGGAGGYRAATGFAVAATTIGSITVGAGGVATSGGQGNAGVDSVFSSITSTGGGGGGYAEGAGASGGSGGGGAANSGAGGSGTVGQGYAGGTGSSADQGAAGGGGAGAVGSNGAAHIGGDGGVGVSNDISSAATFYGGGGGGATLHSTDVGDGGNGGGGNGAYYNGGATQVSTAGTANTGGGGGAGSYVVTTGAAGGSGIVVIRRLTQQSTVENMTLISNAQTAESAPTNGDLVMTITNGAGTTTPNTDIKAYITRDGSDYTSEVTLVDQGDTGGHTILTANNVDLSGETSGTAMRWKITTHNQSVSKTTRIQAVSLGWS